MKNFISCSVLLIVAGKYTSFFFYWHRSGSRCLVTTVQTYLPDLIKTCFIDGLRTTAHKCARLLALCIEWVWFVFSSYLYSIHKSIILMLSKICILIVACYFGFWSTHKWNGVFLQYLTTRIMPLFTIIILLKHFIHYTNPNSRLVVIQ